jgi:hypothetical protein
MHTYEERFQIYQINKMIRDDWIHREIMTTIVTFDSWKADQDDEKILSEKNDEKIFRV